MYFLIVNNLQLKVVIFCMNAYWKQKFIYLY